jgi:hypothetical protein
MADRNGYIGRAPSDSAVTVARQTFTPTGITTDFTFTSGYVPGYFDIYINGVKMIEGSDYTSSDGSTFAVLGGGATNGDVIEAVAYKAFNAASVNNAPGNFSVGGELSFGSVAAGSSVSFATTAFNLDGTPDITVRNFTGVAGTFSGFVAFSTSISVGGTITYEDVENIDSVGLITARNGIDVTGGNVTIGTGSTVGFGSTAYFNDNVRLKFGDDGDLEIYHSTTGLQAGNSIIQETGSGSLKLWGTNINIENSTGSKRYIDCNDNGSVELWYNNSKKFETTGAGVTITGVCTATSFEGSGANLTNLPASGDSNDITACLFI